MMHKKPGGTSAEQPDQHRANRRITLHKQCPFHRTLLLISALTGLGVPAIILATGAAAAALTGGLLLAALGVAWHLRCEELRTRHERSEIKKHQAGLSHGSYFPS